MIAMDLELMVTVGRGIVSSRATKPLKVFFFKGASTFYFTNEHWIYEYTQTLMTLDNPPLVSSLSWGWMEAQQCDDLLNSICNQLGVDSKDKFTSHHSN